MHETLSMAAVETTLSRLIHVVGSAIEIFGVLVIVGGIVWSTYLFLRRRLAEPYYEAYKIRIGRSLLLGLEVLVAADIVKTIALELTVLSLVLLAGLVLVRTFLSWTLLLEVEGRWPWQRRELPAGAARGSEMMPVEDRAPRIRDFPTGR